MNTEELSTLMHELHDDAVAFAKKDYDIELGDELSDIQKVDTIIGQLKQRNAAGFQDKELFTLCNVLGAYIGEVVKQYTGGRWLYDTSDEQAPAVRLMVQQSDYAFASLVYRHLTSSPTISLYEYARNAVERHRK